MHESAQLTFSILVEFQIPCRGNGATHSKHCLPTQSRQPLTDLPTGQPNLDNPYSDSFFRLFQVLSIDNLSQMLSMYCDVATSTAKTHADITTQYNISKGCFCSFFFNLCRESFVWYLLLSLLNLRTFINSEILISVQIEPSLFFLLFFSCNFYLIFSRLSLLISMVLKIIILCLLFPISSKH